MYNSDLDHYTVEPVNTVTNLAVLTGDRINEGFFLQENVWPFCQAAKKRGRNIKRDDDITEEAVRRGFTVQS